MHTCAHVRPVTGANEQAGLYATRLRTITTKYAGGIRAGLIEVNDAADFHLSWQAASFIVIAR